MESPFATFINILTFIAANKLTTAANAIVLQYTAPIFVVLITVFILKRRLKAYEIIAVLVAIVGVVFFFLDQMSPQGMLGNILATVSGFFMALVYALSGEILCPRALFGAAFIIGAVIVYTVIDSKRGNAS